jgi:uncharacterized protein (DUF1800 family)
MRIWLTTSIFAASAVLVSLYMPAQTTNSTVVQQNAGQMQNDPAQPADEAQRSASHTFALKRRLPIIVHAKAEALTPLSRRERVQQLLDRFTFGPQPGEVDRVLVMGEDHWLAQQMNPDSINDSALDKRLADYPALRMSVPQLLLTFPDRPQVYAVMDGRVPYPIDPLENAVYQVLVYKAQQERDVKKADGATVARQESTDAEKAEQKKKDQATAARIAGELFALPRQQRMAALIQMPIEDRIAFTGNGNLSYDQRNELLSEFTPREREALEAMSANVSSTYYIQQELSQTRILRDIMTNRQLQEVMTDFWFNHFNIYMPKGPDEWYTPSYVRDVIRKNALTSFPQLLQATAESPAMMVYLDNWISIGPDSIANGVNLANPHAKKGNRGLNENYGREVMELHTISVNGGYTQNDVTTLSAIMTGWGVDKPYEGGGFLFDPQKHESGPKTWLGYTIDDHGNVTRAPQDAGRKDGKPAPTWDPSKEIATADSMKQGIAALNILAISPKTAHFISYLLAQRFVADDPPPALVDRLSQVYLSSHGDIKTILRALIASPEFNSRQYFHNKVKTPVEFVASAFRTTGTDPQNPQALVNTIRTMGMPLYQALPPTGYYLTADQWMNSTALIDRLNFAYQLTNGKFANQKFDAPKLLALGLLTPGSAMDFSGSVGVKAAKSYMGAVGTPKMIGVASVVRKQEAPTVTPAGTEVALRVLEATMIGAPVSRQTNELINQQLQQQPANAMPTATLNLLTALVMGSPEFQLR